MADDNERGGNALLSALAHPSVVNPLAAYSDAARTANSIWANRDWQAKQAAGEAQQGGIDPATGEYSPNRAMQLLSQRGPDAALAAGPTLESSQRLSDAQLAQAQKKLEWVGKVSQDALTAGDYSDAAMLKLFQGGLAGNMMTLPEIKRQLDTLPPDAAGRKAWLEQHGTLALSDQQRLELRYGMPGTATGPGGQLIGTMTSRQTGAVTQAPGPGVQQGLSPEAGAARVITGYDPKTGQPIYGPAESVAPPQMRPGSSVGPGRLPPALRGPGAQPSAQPGAAGTDPSVVAAPDPRVGAQNEADQKAFLAEQSAIPTHQTAVQSLLNAQHALELTRTGGGTAGAHAIKSYLVAQGVPVPAEWVESAENYDKFAKYAIDYARQQAAGAGTNLQLEAAEHSNANPAMLAGANRAVLQTNIGRERQKIAMNMEAPDQKTGGGYIGHTSKYASHTDPRGFAVDAYTPEELTKLTGGMTDTERKKFWKTVGIADRLGMLNPRQ